MPAQRKGQSMELLTIIKDTQRKHSEMWNWIAEQSERNKSGVCKSEYFSTFGIDEKPLYFCWCCEFVSGVQNLIGNPSVGVGCELCPVKDWEEKNSGSLHPPCARGLYGTWLKSVNEMDYKKAAKIAREIANLQFVERLNITAEQAKSLIDAGYEDIFILEQLDTAERTKYGCK